MYKAEEFRQTNEITDKNKISNFSESFLNIYNGNIFP